MADQLPAPVEDYLTHLAIEKGRSANTLSAYRRDLRQHIEFLDGLSVEQTTAEQIVDYHRHLQARGLAPASVNRAMTVVRGLHRFLVTDGVTSVDPTADVQPGRLPRGLPKALSEAEIARLIDAVRASDASGRRDRAILEVLYGTGMRISELVSLSLDDLDLEGSLMRVTGKGDKQRLVPVGRLAHSSLLEWLAPAGRSSFVPDRWSTREAERAVFLNRRGGRLSRQGVWGVVRRHGLKAGIADRLTPHVLRHSCATHMLDHGADIRTVQELLGHASVSTTQLYTKVSTDLLVRQYASAHPRARRRPGVT